MREAAEELGAQVAFRRAQRLGTEPKRLLRLDVQGAVLPLLRCRHGLEHQAEVPAEAAEFAHHQSCFCLFCFFAPNLDHPQKIYFCDH